MKASRPIAQACIVFLLALTALCLPVFAALPGSDDDSGGIGGTGIRGYGHIQRFGSIFVNGREYFINKDTLILVDGKPASELDLQIGNMVHVEGVGDPAGQTAHAKKIISEHQLVGRVEAVNAKQRRITVLGQSILTEAVTHLRDTSPPLRADQFSVGDILAINGLPLADGSWRATLIQRALTDEFRLNGRIMDFEPATRTVAIGKQRLILAAGINTKNLKPGMEVRATGHYTDAGPEIRTLEDLNQVIGQPGERVELEGHLHPQNGSGQFITTGVALAAPPATLKEVGKLREQQRVILLGRIDSRGEIVVEQIRPELERPEIEGIQDIMPIEHPRPEFEHHGIQHHEFERPEFERPEIEH